jgi:hypothetical protein
MENSQVTQCSAIRWAAGVREKRGSIYDTLMHNAQRTQVIVERVPDQYRICANEPRQRAPYGLQR